MIGLVWILELNWIGLDSRRWFVFVFLTGRLYIGLVGMEAHAMRFVGSVRMGGMEWDRIQLN